MQLQRAIMLRDDKVEFLDFTKATAKKKTNN